MSDNKSAFNATEYDRKIKQTIPYYDEFYEQVIELVNTYYDGKTLAWLDAGCGTGKMASVAFEHVELERFVFCDGSDKMMEIVKERFGARNAEFVCCDVQDLSYDEEFDVLTAIQVNHYFPKEQRRSVLKKYYEALKKDGLYISFENFAPFSAYGECICLKKWKKYQMQMGKSLAECEKHMGRYGKEYYPITLTETIELMRDCGFKAVEVLWLSNMQVGIWGMK